VFHLDAEPVVETLDLARRGRELVLGALVADEDDASLGEQIPRRGKTSTGYDMSCRASKIVTRS
jgi:hypothetical protein